MNKLLVVCGGTGTGKTALGIALAKKFNGEIVSADSRQVYLGMDLGTGKDRPTDGTPIWGLDLVDPKKSFSVSQYVKMVKPIIADIQRRGKLPILVGGTGLYIKAITEGFETLDVPKNRRLRELISKLKVDELYEKLCELDGVRAARMNCSDRQNPRRLIRAIEVAQWQIKHQVQKKVCLPPDVLRIGLGCELEKLKEKITDRSKKMLADGLLEEIKKLLKLGVTWKMQSMATIGYCEWRGFLEGRETREVSFQKWVGNQLSYVRRQNLWFKKDKTIKWFDINDNDYIKKVEMVVTKWYSGSNDSKD